MNLIAVYSRPGYASNTLMFIGNMSSSSTCIAQFRLNVLLASGSPTCFLSAGSILGLIVGSFFGVHAIVGGCLSGSDTFSLTSPNYLISSTRLATFHQQKC